MTYEKISCVVTYETRGKKYMLYLNDSVLNVRKITLASNDKQNNGYITKICVNS